MIQNWAVTMVCPVTHVPKNAASESFQQMMDVMNEWADAIPADVVWPFVEDFVLDDRRRLVGTGPLNRDELRRSAELNWELGGGAIQRVEVFAVRSERGAACERFTNYANRTSAACIDVYYFNERVSRVQRWTIFDHDQKQDALVELDRLHAELDA
jgi:hypothetical protein